MLKVKLQRSGLLIQRADSLEKTLMLGKIKGRRKRGTEDEIYWMASPTQWTRNLSKLWDIVKDREAWCAAVYEVTKGRTQLSD